MMRRGICEIAHRTEVNQVLTQRTLSSISESHCSTFYTIFNPFSSQNVQREVPTLVTPSPQVHYVDLQPSAQPSASRKCKRSSWKKPNAVASRLNNSKNNSANSSPPKQRSKVSALNNISHS